MSLEERWAQQREWGAEGDEIEISRERRCDGGKCQVSDCTLAALFEVELKRIQDRSGEWFMVCKDHNDNETLYEMYESRVTSLRG